MIGTENFTVFDGRNWETSSFVNFMASRGFKAPHSGMPYSEALLMGVSGGAVMGYFSFAYEGYDPMCRILTRNTFDPLDTMLSRLGVVQDLRQSTSPGKGLKNLLDVLESGEPAIVWADSYSLPYNAHKHDAGMWMMTPVLVFGVDEAAGVVHIADRSSRPLEVSLEDFQAARGRVNKDRFKLMTISPPNPDKLASAVQAGIWDCINLFTEKPPKGSRNNFGLKAYRFWIEQLTRPKARLSWARVFPAGRKMFAGLLGAYHSVNFFDGFPQAERGLYADFLNEAAGILARPGLKVAAEKFREAGQAWDALSQALLPDRIDVFKEAKEVMHRRYALFEESGAAALDEIKALEDRLVHIRKAMETGFPLTEPEAAAFLAGVADRVEAVHDIEEAAVNVLREAMG